LKTERILASYLIPKSSHDVSIGAPKQFGVDLELPSSIHANKYELRELYPNSRLSRSIIVPVFEKNNVSICENKV